MLKEQAAAFIRQFMEETASSGSADARIQAIHADIDATGTYTHTPAELTFGARLAWREADRCIGRLFWQQLTVFDERETTSPEAVHRALSKHLTYAANGGRIRPAVTIFPPAGPQGDAPVRIQNHQLLRYAGWKDGTGDPASIEITAEAEKAGWQADQQPFALLPLLLDTPRGRHCFSWQPEVVQEVSIRHPQYDFSSLNLRWYTVPAVSDMELVIGGIVYPAAPFNGWYMGTEIGARNFADQGRYNQLPAVADLLGLDRQRHASLWKDEALVELNKAVLFSFQEDRVSIVDHHTAALQFDLFQTKEAEAGRRVNGEWSWLIPPLSPAATSVFHQSFEQRTSAAAFRWPETHGVTVCPFTGERRS
ncbi:nitric oxide synthase oxygenase [Alkalicoccus chagannorensis]|uniref:nitric oxide synthase oxygenase n=1 Tax=Alkalicoccus chagannorensis TaxID=427072 RepID=UPI0003FBB5C5|nr:nitric oxide synthase oxygenase [Alkalicoccus chagannorensis]